MKYHLVINPNAGRGYAGKIQSRLIEDVKRALGAVEVHPTSRPGDIRKIAAGLKMSKSVFMVAGGDGTIHEAVNGLAGGNCLLGIIPIGSGNDFIRMLNLPLKYTEAIDRIKNQRTMSIDIGRVGERVFVNGLGIGFDARAVVESQKVTSLRGNFIYLYAILKTIFLYKNDTVTVEKGDKKEKRKIFLISAGNGAFMGGGFRITPKAKINDGLLDFGIIRGLTKGEIFAHLPKVIKGTHLKLAQVEYFQATSLTIESENGVPVQVDGELLSPAMKHIDIRIEKDALQVIHNLDEYDKAHS